MTRLGWVVLQSTETTTAAGDQPSLFDGLPGFIPEIIPRIIIAVAIVVVAYFASRTLVQLLSRRIARRFRRPSLTRTVLRSIQTLILLAAGFLAMFILGLEISDLTLSVTVFSAAVGFILAPIIGSIVNGLFVLSDQAYEIGDMIELVDRGQTGFVEDITLRYTKIFTLDNTFLVIPNGQIRDRDVVNYSAEDERTRLALDMTVTYEGDLTEARRLMEQAAAEVPDVIEGGPDIRIGSARYPAKPTCYIDTFADHGVNLRLRYWVKQPYKLLSARSAVQENVWERLDEADVSIPYPHSHVVFDETSGELNVSMDEGLRQQTR
ncbi:MULTISPECIES: mechanosensitive ion channel family protein [unclassified Haladaptatus]|uniref:mechanosensitive ion channel family protein n=1 Tax=unclassified Haladaptatus TaxID=2622732 RepID=UPI0023E86F31|nr:MULTISPECIES: mechanosensitive ion channel family protein [unclassified Haladaptatus]